MQPLPTIHAAGGLPTILIDTREQTPLTFARLPSRRCADGAGLLSGDYTIDGAEDHFAVERKSVADLVACCYGSNRERFERELSRLRGYAFKALLIVGTRAEIEEHKYRSQILPQAVLASLDAWYCRYGIAHHYAATPAIAAELIERWAMYYARGVRHAAKAIRMVEVVESAETHKDQP